nr:PREDICTED: follistatin-related protein 5-like isoform X1 [Bemisia tabaci]
MTVFRLLVLLFYVLTALEAKQRSRHHRDSFETSTSAPVTSSFLEDYDDDITALTDRNPCLVHYCGKGRVCRVVGGRAECECVRRCVKRQKPVCGSDGKLYDNHCELHRIACQTNSIVAVDHTFACLNPDKETRASTSAPVGRKIVRVLHSINTTSLTAGGGGGGPPPPVPLPRALKLVAAAAAANEVPDDASLFRKELCTAKEYENMMENLLLHMRKKLVTLDAWSAGREYFVNALFKHCDLNSDSRLVEEELNQVFEKEHLEQLSKQCALSDLLVFNDENKDGELSLNEFYAAFSKLYSVSVVSLDKALETNHLEARVGDNVEIKCDVTGSPQPPIVWRRYDADLASLGEEDVRVFADGSLYLTRIQLVHAGNYTCHAQTNDQLTQTHVLTVHTVPQVKVTPKIQSRRPGEVASMLCHVVGEPFPKVDWLKNKEPLRLDSPRKYEVVGNGTELRIRNTEYADTGAFMCQASNIGGVTRDISSLIIQEQPTPTAPNEERRFFTFHDWGVSVYEPSACRLYHQIQSTDIIPGTQEYVCGDKGVNCSWGQAINVANRYIYVTQPTKDRVLVISKIQMVVVDVVATDSYPVALHYVPHLDQVWVLNWRDTSQSGAGTVQVIRGAAQKRKHHTVHPEPIDGHFDLVNDLFMPPVQDMNHMLKYGYVSHTNQRGLYKLDLGNMRYVRSVDLSPYNCVPQTMQFSALYGFVIIECVEPLTKEETGQLLLDYLTDTVISVKPELIGTPTLSPNSRILVTLSRKADGVTLIIQQVTEGGLKFLFDVKTTLNISDLTFYPSQTTHGYDLYASAIDKEDILFLNLVTGKVEMITGVGRAMKPALAQWGNPNRPIAASGIFGHYMVTPADEALFVINGETRTVNCEIGGLVHPRSVVWVTMQLQ